MKFLSLSMLALASSISSVYSAALPVSQPEAIPAPIPSSTVADVPSKILAKRVNPWPTHLPNNWIAYAQTGGAYGGPVISAMITIGLGDSKANAIIQSFSNSGQNMVSEYGYNTWYHLSSVAGLQSSMAIVKVTGYFDYEWITDAVSNSGYMTMMLRFNLLSGTAASVAPTVANAMAQFWRIGHIEANYNPQRISQKRDLGFTEFHEEAARGIEKRADQCFHKYSTSPNDKVDRFGGFVPRSTSCELHK